MTPAALAALLIERITDTTPMFPVAVFREHNGGWLYLHDGLDLVVMCGDGDDDPRARIRVVRVDLRGCRDVVEAMGRVERETAELVLL